MSLLFLLPVEIWREHILQFHSLLDTVKVNSACLSRQVQLQLRLMMDGLTLTPFYSLDKGQVNKHLWCLERNILPLKVSMRGDLDSRTVSFLPELCARATDAMIIETMQNFNPAYLLCLVSLELLECSMESVGSLALCPNIATLSLDNCSRLTTESVLHSLVGCIKLTECTIEECEMIDQSGVSQIWNQLPHLVSFQLGGSYRQPHPYNLSTIVENCTLQPSDTHRLRSVVAWKCTVCNLGLQKLAGLLPQLHKLHLSDPTSNASDIDVNVLCRNCPQLKEITLNHFKHLTSTALKSIAHSLPLLRHLSVSRCTAISDEGVIAVAKGCAQIIKLNISYCEKVTDTAVREVWLHCVLLQDLILSGCVLITDAAFLVRTNDTLRALHASHTCLHGKFAKQAPKLVRLYCDQCSNLNSDFVYSIAHCPSIKTLWLSETQLSVTDLLALSIQLPQLQSLKLTSSLANDEVVHSFVTNCPYLQYVRINQCAAVTEATKNELTLIYKSRL